jgi:N-methylhydantoinase A
MGGTSTDCSTVIAGQISFTTDFEVEWGLPIQVPMIDVRTIGAGGGTIAFVDEGGLLRVGPKSAGARPGPACYDKGGTEPTVTDANVVLGRIGASSFLGGEMPLDEGAARAGIADRLAPLDLDVTEAAIGIVRLAVANMVLAVRGVSVERGYDPRDFALLAQGGNGPLHALEIARELNVPTVVVPRLPAIFSAVGMLMADLRHDYVQTHYTALADADADLAELDERFEELVGLGRERLQSEGVGAGAMSFERSLDLRYVGQEFALAVRVEPEELRDGDETAIRARFHAAHEHRYGYATVDEEVEMVNLRVVARGARARPALPPSDGPSGDSLLGRRDVWLADPAQPVSCAVHARDRMRPGDAVVGPAVIEERTSTTLLWEGDVASVAPGEELIVEVARTAHATPQPDEDLSGVVQ